MILFDGGKWHGGIWLVIARLVDKGFTEWRPLTCTVKHPTELEIAWVYFKRRCPAKGAAYLVRWPVL